MAQPQVRCTDLSEAEATARLKSEGANELPQRQRRIAALGLLDLLKRMV